MTRAHDRHITHACTLPSQRRRTLSIKIPIASSSRRAPIFFYYQTGCVR